jgi:hypothetical protein
MELITKVLRALVPPLYGTENDPDPMVWVRIFSPWSDWTWYVVEIDEQGLCFGLVQGFEEELGYFSLSELEQVRGPGGLKVERDLYFEPMRLSELRTLCKRD